MCFVVERDDVEGIKRMYFEKDKSLHELYLFILEAEALPADVQRRFRKYSFYYAVSTGISFSIWISMTRIWRICTSTRRS